MLLKGKLYRPGLEEIVSLCSGAVCIDIGYILHLKPGILHRVSHRSRSSGSVLCGRSDVVSVVSSTVSYYLGKDLSSSCLSMLELLENYDTGTFTDNESVSVLIERS